MSVAGSQRTKTECGLEENKKIIGEEEQAVISNYEIMRNQMRGEYVKYNQEKMIKKFSLKNDEN